MTEISETAARGASALRVLIGRLRRRLQEVYDVSDFTPSQTSVLSRLSKDGPASASDLAAAERVRPQSIAATLAVLGERGMIQRRPDPNDGRRQVISLSENAHEHIRSGRAARNEWLSRQLEDRYTEEERQKILEVLALLERLTD
ncbi:MarR family winged helix-turn-helix transcriptional regulator [Phaeacidiphilus oryzae]|uniref:MarR family winged helix-turn-helix transcriptional regulator n=1 Tax=Phaeacidiphilus oryzae TaxID=348818 RepID=UPI00056C24E9|nr:MarR family transcriptional regulator [Phaeacidiphilus oryzae]